MAVPFRLHYAYTEELPADADSGVIVGNWWVARRQVASAVKSIDRGEEVLIYSLPVHDYPGNYSEPEQALYYSGGGTGKPTRREWAWDPVNPSRVTVPAYAGMVMDVREGSPYLEHLLADFYPGVRTLIDAGKASGVMLDVTGDGYWGAFAGLTATDKAAMSAGERWFVKELRGVLGERAIIVVNNALAGPWDHIDGILVENHAPSEAGFWRTQAGYVKRTVRRRVCGIQRTAADAEAWSKLGVFDAVGGQSSYQVAPRLPISSSVRNGPWPAGVGHVRPGTTPPPPPPAETDAQKIARLTLELAAATRDATAVHAELVSTRTALAQEQATSVALAHRLELAESAAGAVTELVAARGRQQSGRAEALADYLESIGHPARGARARELAGNAELLEREVRGMLAGTPTPAPA